MANLGFIGLGLMGYPMARNLLDAGHNVALWSHSPGKAQKLAADKGGTLCNTPAEVAAHADCMFYCVGDSQMSTDLCLGTVEVEYEITERVLTPKLDAIGLLAK